MEWEEKRNPYQVLGLEPDPDVDEGTIKKAYKALSLKLHPDKNPSPTAAEEFSELQKASQVLLDKAARGALDDYLRAKAQRAQRESVVSDKRRKLREELDKRERQAAGERSEEEIARQRLKMELERLRKRAEEEGRQARQQQAEAAAAAAAAARVASAATTGPDGGAASTSSDGQPSAAVQAQLLRMLKVSWDPAMRNYTSDDIRAALAAIGGVEDVVVRDRISSKRKASALVVMDSEDAAWRAAGSVCGDPSEPLLVVPLLKEQGADGNAGDGGAPGASAADDDGLLPKAGPGVAGLQGVSQRTTRLPDHPPAASASGRPLFPTTAAGPGRPAFPVGGGAQKPAFPVAGGGGSASHPTAWASSAGAGVSGASSFPAASSFPGGAAAEGGSASNSFEAQILEKMRRAAERDRALAAARQAAEAEAADGAS